MVTIPQVKKQLSPVDLRGFFSDLTLGTRILLREPSLRQALILSFAEATAGAAASLRECAARVEAATAAELAGAAGVEAAAAAGAGAVTVATAVIGAAPQSVSSAKAKAWKGRQRARVSTGYTAIEVMRPL